MLLGVWGFIAATIADYGIKPYILHGQSNLHPLLALLSVLGGVETLGLIGIFVGPMVVAFLQALLNILRTDLQICLQAKKGEIPDKSDKLHVAISNTAPAVREGILSILPPRGLEFP